MNGNRVTGHSSRLTRAAGGKRDPNNKLWELFYKEAMALGLENRIVKGNIRKWIVLGKKDNKDPTHKSVY